MVKRPRPESVRQVSRDAKEVPTPEFNADREVSLQVMFPRSEQSYNIYIYIYILMINAFDFNSSEHA